MKRPGPLLTLLAGLLLGLLTLALDATAGTRNASSPSPSEIADASCAGRTDDVSSSVAASVRDGRAVAHFCDGYSKESWLKARVRSDGTMRLTGGRYAFTALDAVEDSGLYRATATVRGARVDGGWIVLADGCQVGIVDREGAPSSAPRIDPATGAVTVDGQRLTAEPVLP
ncbi:hypothetical protein ABZ646_34915 [Streptomyces sp. NPDC007162]|uniref:hypothetical protein n=1 Tax=Streptomyces sp. NPDC007162 TaxID=3156917 RepID=UPI0033F7ED57